MELGRDSDTGGQVILFILSCLLLRLILLGPVYFQNSFSVFTSNYKIDTLFSKNCTEIN